MGLFKSLKKLTLKKVAKVVAKVAPVAAVLVPGVGPVIAGGIAIATKVSGALSAAKQKVEAIQDIVSGPAPPAVDTSQVLVGGPAPGMTAGIGAMPQWLVPLLLIGAIWLFFFKPKRGRR